MILPKTPSFRLDGRRALVVGATSGIGLGAAAAMAEAGAAVTLAARSADRLGEVAAAFIAEGWSADTLTLDAADAAAVAVRLEDVEPFDIHVNSSGLARHAPALDTTMADFDAVTAINLRGAYFLAQAVAKGMQQAGKGGSIITISSQMGHVGGIDRAVYCATKHAVEGFTKAMAVEWAPLGIRVNTIGPTFVRTPLTDQTFENPERAAWVESKIPLGRIATVEDLMGAVLFLAGDASAMVTGTALMVDGGWTAD